MRDAIVKQDLQEGESRHAWLEDILVRQAMPLFKIKPGKRRPGRLTHLSEETVAKVQEKQRWTKILGQLTLAGAGTTQREWVQRKLSDATKIAKASVRNDRRANAEVLAEELEASLAGGDARSAFQMVRTLAPKARAANVSVKLRGSTAWSKDEELTARELAIVDIYRGKSVDPADEVTTVVPEHTDTPEQSDCLTEEDVERMIETMPRFKAGQRTECVQGRWWGAGAELYQICQDVVTPELRRATIEWMTRGKAAPTMMKDCSVCHLRKPGKGDGSDAKEHCRMIALLNHWGKAVMKQAMDREGPTLRAGASLVQFGALPARGTRDAILIVDEIAQRVAAFSAKQPRARREPLMVFQVLFDLSKAFDLIDREKAWRAMEKKGVSAACLSLLRDMHAFTASRVAGCEARLSRGSDSLHSDVRRNPAGHPGRQKRRMARCLL